MSVKINLPGKEDVREIAGEIAAQTAAMKAYFSAAQSGLTFVQTWAEFKHLCQLGTIKKYFAVGDKLKCQYNGKDLLWDIAHIGDNEDGSNYVILQTHYCLDETMPFDGQEAIFKAPAELSAGTYHFKMPLTGVTDTDWTDPTKSGWSKTWQFTTTKSVPKGGIIKFENIAEYNVDIATRKIVTRASPESDANIETLSLTEGTAGTDLATLGTVNHAQRACFGYNRWRDSDIRQWLNSGAEAGKWWSQRNDFDTRTTMYGAAGFMHGLDEDFKAVITKSKITTNTNKITEDGSNDTTYDYFFLPTMKNLNAGDQDSTNPEDTTIWDYYKKFRQDGKTGENSGRDPNRLKGTSTGGDIWWWERSPVDSDTYYVRNVVPREGIASWGHGAYFQFGVAPACRIN
jgi:hypothetical protein|nr:DUF6273 domain-containing protein [uncultured Dialister sp.]DAP87108.1 MAG TPA: hypothetical protein [Caudoviricetes sp.]